MRPTASLLALSLLPLLVACGSSPVEEGDPAPSVAFRGMTLTAACGGCTSTAPSYPSLGCGRDKREVASAPVKDGLGVTIGTIRHMYSPTCQRVWAEYESTVTPAMAPASGAVRVQVIQANAYGLGTGCWAQDAGTTLTSPMAEVGYSWAGVDQSRVVGCLNGACGGTTLRAPR